MEKEGLCVAKTAGVSSLQLKPLCRGEQKTDRAGVMSRNEEEKRNKLMVWILFVFLKANIWTRRTVLREGMSMRNNGRSALPPRVTERGFRNVINPSAASVVSLGKSIHYFISSSSLRMINSVESSSSLKQNASFPS